MEGDVSPDIFVVNSLPVTKTVFINNTDFVASGFDGRPFLLSLDSTKITLK